jgi:hypothetical protein
MRRWLSSILAAALLLQAGCAGRITLTEEELADPEPAKSYSVKMKDGREYTFISLHLEGGSLLGTARITTREEVGKGEEKRVNISNRYEEMKLPWGEVESVEAELGKKKLPSLLLAAVAVAAGVGLFVLLTNDSDSGTTDDGGKEPPPAP